ncbi:MAG: class I SAM-dependent DNA methyltransferase [Campylobacter sp.]|nr:class I SAM-dependent DNA methyltransferase [Campylobacter sp.]
MKLTLNLLEPQNFIDKFLWKNEVKNAEKFNEAVEFYKSKLSAYAEHGEPAIVANALSKFFEKLEFVANSQYSQSGATVQSAIDLALMKNNKDTNPYVIIEAKRQGKGDFISEFDANKKALHECILYYFREQEKRLNFSLKHIIITDFENFYIFKAEEFKKIFLKNNKFRELYSNVSNTDEFYKGCEKIINSDEFFKNKQIQALHLNINDFNPDNPNKSKAFYKAFSKDFLLGEFSYDPNKISKKFYDELLYLLGLKEQQGGSLQPNGVAGSLYENIFARLSTPSFETAMQLIILWLNRILFLKLIETNLLNFNKNPDNESFEYKKLKFLNYDKIHDFDTLDELFFSVLAKPLNDENRKKSKFAYLPYLNSSIFQKQNIEKELGINALDNGATIQIYPATSLYDEKHKKRTGEILFLQYLFEFLDSFDFGENHSDENKSDLISSAVLGQVFERLNGYKDGSFYTPSFITSYMCKESINKIVLERFAKEFDLNFDDLDIDKLENIIELKLQKSSDITALFTRLNAIINDIKICDPAVGSGYFLVSALNYIIALKSRLGILVDENGKLLKAKIKYENDELDIMYNDSTRFYYSRPKSADEAGQIIQKTLFNEKAGLIENCLFGVDINPNSCEIARLRLWIELLKNSYFTDFSPNPLQQNALETLPNIDINIKCGNSLVSYFNLKNKISIPKIANRINIYKNLVNSYKQGKGDKTELLNEIRNLQTLFKNYCFTTSSHRDKIKKFKEQCEIYTKQYGDYLAKDNPKLKDYVSKSFFVDFDEETAKKDYEKLLKLYDEIFSLDNLNPFEWRFEFPEILDENGDFMGFDLIIANPPYIRQEAIKEQKSALQSKFKIFCSTADIYTYFFEIGLNILKNNGILSFITSNKFFRASYGQNLREFMLKNAQIQSITDLNGLKVFDSAIVDTAVTILQKQKPQKSDIFAFSNPKTKDFKSAEILKISQSDLNSESFIFLNSLEANLKAKIERLGTPLKDWDINIYRGILTGLNEAFIIDEATRADILDNCSDDDERKRTEAIIKPILRGRDIKRYSYEWAKIYLINFHNGYTCADGVKIPPLDIADFPSLKRHFDKFEPALSKRTDKGKTPYNLRNCAYLEEFEKEKIIWAELARTGNAFTFDKNNFSLTNTAYALTTNSENLKYILCFLNSKITLKFLDIVSAKLDETGWRWLKQNLEKIPIPKISKEKEAEFVNLVDKILKETDENERAKLSGEIDKLVYQIYDLNADEIALIEKA